jgi:hypothetical protein
VKLSSEVLVEGHESERRSTPYLVREREVKWAGTDRRLNVQVAFRLDDKGQITEDGTAGQLDVFFPTDEQTRLKFRLHGPFLLTDNRANVK